MTKIEKFIINKLVSEEYILTTHTRERMSERSITDADIVELARNFRSMKRQPQNDTYLLKGRSSWGDKMAMSVAVRENVIVVTVFFEEEL